MSSEIVKLSNQFNNVALRKFDATHLDVLMAIASRVKERGTEEVRFTFDELRQLMRLRKNLTNGQLADKIVQTNARLLALNYMFVDEERIVQFALFTKFETNPREQTLSVRINEEFAFLLNDLTSQFTRFELEEFAGLRSRYAKEFYRRAKQYRSTGLWLVSREDFCRLMDAPKLAMTQTRYLNDKILKPIMEECGPLMNLEVQRNYKKRRLVSFAFMFSTERPPAPEPEAKPTKAKPSSSRPVRFGELEVQQVMAALDADPADPDAQIKAKREAMTLLHAHGSADRAIEVIRMKANVVH